MREMTARDLQARGVDADEAQLTARRIFGSSALAGDRSRDVWIPRAFQGLGQDFRLARRAHSERTPVVSSVAVLSLALGIGANAAIFSLVNSLLLRTLPVPEPGRLVLLSKAASRNPSGWSIRVWEEIQRRPELFEKAAGWSSTPLNLATGGETQFINGIWATGSFFETLGVRALLGRTFSEDDDRPGGGAAGPVMVISHGFWQRHFGGAPDVIGRRLMIHGVPVSIIGVRRRTSRASTSAARSRWRYRSATSRRQRPRQHAQRRRVRARIIARLKPGQTSESDGRTARGATGDSRDGGAGDAARRIGLPYIRDALQTPSPSCRRRPVLRISAAATDSRSS